MAGAVALAMAGAVWAQPARGEAGGRRGPDGMPERMARYLELTEAQQQQARELFEARRPQMESLHEQMRGVHERLRAALESEAPDATLVGELTLEQLRLRQQGRAQRVEMQKAFKALLSPEQQKKAEALEAARELGPGPRGHGPHGPGRWDEGFPGPVPPEPPEPR